MKNIFLCKLALSLLFLISIAMAHAEDCQWRLGIGLGGEYVNLEGNLTDDVSLSSNGFADDRKQTQKVIRIAPSLEGGLTFLSDYYFGLLAGWTYTDAQTKSREPFRTSIYFIQKFKMPWKAQLLVKMGYKVTPKTLVYGLIGPSIAKWSHMTQLFDSANPQTTSIKMSKKSVGLGLGFGLEYCFLQNIAFSIDYSHYFYKYTLNRQNFSFIDHINGRDFSRTGLVSKKVRPSYDSIALRLTYFF